MIIDWERIQLKLGKENLDATQGDRLCIKKDKGMKREQMITQLRPRGVS